MKKKELLLSHWNMNKNQLARLRVIQHAIRSGYPDVEALAERCRKELDLKKNETPGEATIYRDLKILKEGWGYPIDRDDDKGGYYYYNEKFDYALNKLNTDDVFYLSAAKTLLSTFEGSPVYTAIADVINFMTDLQGIGKSKLLNRVVVPPVPLVVTKDKSIWGQILAALQDNRIIEFDYSGRWNPETTHRRVRPYQLVLDNGLCYIFGYSEERGEERLFTLNRITNLVVTGDSFELPQDYEFSHRTGGGRFGAFIGEGPVEFVVDFYGDAREYIKACIWADDQKLEDFDEEDKTRVTFSCSQELPVKQWILRQAGNAVPVSPDWFVEQWKSVIRDMAESAGLL